jgi:hypothetical protein
MSEIMAWTNYHSHKSSWLSDEADLNSPGFPFEMRDGKFVEIVGRNVIDHSSPINPASLFLHLCHWFWISLCIFLSAQTA